MYLFLYPTRCGRLAGVYSTVDFGPTSKANIAKNFLKVQRLFEPDGPLVNSEFYPGWLDHWGSPHSMKNASVVSIVRFVQGKSSSDSWLIYDLSFSGILNELTSLVQSCHSIQVADSLDAMLSLGANVNMYLAHGGTSFGFTAGANLVP